MKALKPCGTNGETPCDACKKAWADEHRAYLARASEEVIAKKRRYDKAYGRALSRLADAHRAELDALVADEIERGTP